MRRAAVLAIFAMTACSQGEPPAGTTTYVAQGAVIGGRSVQEISAPVGANGSVLMDGLASVIPEPALRGLLIRATSIAPTQGYYGSILLPAYGGAPDSNGIVTFAFRAFPPEVPQPVGAPRSRQLTAAVFIQDSELANVRGFRVLSRTNTVSLAR
ncbi:hypothetical protein ACW9UR_12575 [Halovulum sp. GXIMD14794]